MLDFSSKGKGGEAAVPICFRFRQYFALAILMQESKTHGQGLD
jgi:hypothetical protein